MRNVYQVVDGTEMFLQVPLTCTAKTATSGTPRTYDIKGRVRSEPHAATGNLHYVAEFYVVQDHWTKIIPVTVAQVLGKGAVLLSADAKIVTVSVDDTSVDSPIYPPNE
jgi:hypothetical protein